MDEGTGHPVDDFRLSDGTYMVGGHIVADRDTAASTLEEMRAETESDREAGGPFVPATEVCNALPTFSVEWFFVMRMVEEEDRHPSDEHLRRLIEEKGVPDYARAYVYARVGRGPGKRSMREPEDWNMFGVFRAEQAAALMELLDLHDRLASYETADPRVGRAGWRFRWLSDGGLPLRYIAYRGVWRVKGARVQARRLVAARYHVEPSTLEGWEREFRESDAWLGQVF